MSATSNQILKRHGLLELAVLRPTNRVGFSADDSPRIMQTTNETTIERLVHGAYPLAGSDLGLTIRRRYQVSQLEYHSSSPRVGHLRAR
jgi:hypothetical protein